MEPWSRVKLAPEPEPGSGRGYSGGKGLTYLPGSPSSTLIRPFRTEARRGLKPPRFRVVLPSPVAWRNTYPVTARRPIVLAADQDLDTRPVTAAP
jgi:hypothetical protein